MLAHLHHNLGHTVVIFVGTTCTPHLCSIFDSGWGRPRRWHRRPGVKCGAAQSGNAQAIQSGELKGLISTPIGDTGLNMNHPNFRCVIVFSAHGGRPVHCSVLGESIA